MPTPTVDELAKKIETLESDNASLKLKVETMNTKLATAAVQSQPLAAVNMQTVDARTLLEKENKIVELQSKLNVITVKMDNRYTAEDISTYLGSIIDDFNTKANEGDSPVAYMVSNLDLELKAQVVKDGNEFKFMSADPESKSSDSMSTIKISVKAVPK